jgi:hypothetical protein
LLSTVDQLNGCDEHLFIPVLIAFAVPVDAGDDWVAYQIGGREQYFINCAASGFPAIDVPHYSSKEISALNPAAIGHPIIEAARKIFDGEVVG